MLGLTNIVIGWTDVLRGNHTLISHLAYAGATKNLDSSCKTNLEFFVLLWGTPSSI